MPQPPRPCVQNVGVSHLELAAFEVLTRPRSADDVRDTCGDNGVFNQDVRHWMARIGQRIVGVSVPSALEGEYIVCGTEEAVPDDRIAPSKPIHSVGIRVAKVGADDLDVVEYDVPRLSHLNLPCATSDDAGDALDRDLRCVIHHDAMPVRLVHPAVIVGWILWAVIHDDPATQRPLHDPPAIH